MAPRPMEAPPPVASSRSRAGRVPDVEWVRSRWTPAGKQGQCRVVDLGSRLLSPLQPLSIETLESPGWAVAHLADTRVCGIAESL